MEKAHGKVTIIFLEMFWWWFLRPNTSGLSKNKGRLRRHIHSHVSMVVLELLVLGITLVDSWSRRLGIELQPMATKKKHTMPLVMNYTEIWNDLEEIRKEFNENIILKIVIKHCNQ